MSTASFDYEKLQPVLAQRFYLCHGKQVQTQNVRIDSKALVSQHAQSIYQQVVASKIMPMNNATGITEAERLLAKQWFEAGGKKNRLSWPHGIKSLLSTRQLRCCRNAACCWSKYTGGSC